MTNKQLLNSNNLCKITDNVYSIRVPARKFLGLPVSKSKTIRIIKISGRWGVCGNGMYKHYTSKKVQLHIESLILKTEFTDL